MSVRPVTAADWSTIDTVLLDMDGTLLDLAYDNHFWQRVVPEAWGRERGLDAAAAGDALRPRFRAREGTLDWYCIDYWSRELGLDIAALKRADTSRIRWLPGALGWVRSLRARGKRVVLLTNAHPTTLAIKDAATAIIGECDASFSSHVFGAPKEDPRFWSGLGRFERYIRERALFVDDSLPVLRAARAAGIGYLTAVRRPDAGAEARRQREFAAVDSVVELG